MSPAFSGHCVRLAVLAALGLFSCSTIYPRTTMCTATHLKTEFQVDPLGIDNPHPRLSWEVQSSRRGDRQTFSRILVASDPAVLSADRGDLWDSGKIPGDRTIMVPYAGSPLTSHQRCVWKVMVWDVEGNPGAWSETAEWSMGILGRDEWRAAWIGFDTPRRDEHGVQFSNARWIWHAADKSYNAPPGKRYFARVVDLTPGARVARADLAVTADDRYRLFVNGREVAASAEDPDAWKTPRRRNIAEFLVGGANVFYVEAENLAQGPAGLLFWLRIVMEDGQVETVVSDRTWMSSDSPHPSWRTEGPKVGEGAPSEALGNVGVPPWRLLDEREILLPPPRYLAASLTLTKTPTRAVLYVSALGICDAYLNNTRISDDSFTPGWTDYARRVYYRAYDVSEMVRKGKNILGGILADGWYSGYIGWGLVRDHYGSKTRLKMQLHVEYDDGSTEEFGSGPDWRGWTGPLHEADFLMGEMYDAREAGKGEFTSRAIHTYGKPVDVGSEGSPIVQAHPGPPVRPFAEITPVSVRRLRPGVVVFDLGRNFAGVVRLRVKGTAAQRVTLRYAERLNPDGSLYVQNLRGARAVDTYICSGGVAEWQPRFTFHGFQYVEVSGLSETPSTEMITGVALSSDTEPAGEFASSSSLLNTLASNILWTQRANFIDVPTDCPQRDERLGWTGDAQIYNRAACLNTDVQAFFHKWLVDLTDAQRADGQFPMVAPLKVADDDGGPAWADAGVVCPWTIYEIYGDTSVLSDHYEAMKRFVEFTRSRCTPDLLPPAQFHCFGDWLNIQADTPKEVIYTAYFARAASIMADAARVLGKKEDATRYDSLAREVRAAFQRAYVDSTGKVLGDTQTGYALALGFGLLEESVAQVAAGHLMADLERRGWNLSTGFVGTKDLMLTLSSLGRQDIAYRLLFNETFPSWGFTIRNGATSIWERWDGWTPDKGFQDPMMNSFAHYAFGAVYQWMVENIGGIRPAEPGFGRMTIAPVPSDSLSFARVSYRSVRGTVRCEWKREGRRFAVAVEVPANTVATLTLPRVDGPVLESSRPVEERGEIRPAGKTPEGGVVLEAGGGRYLFEYDALP